MGLCRDLARCGKKHLCRPALAMVAGEERLAQCRHAYYNVYYEYPPALDKRAGTQT